MEASLIKDLKPSRVGDDCIAYGREFHWAIVLGKKEYFR